MEDCFNTIVIIGKIASGKTTLAEELSKRLNATVVSFGNYVRHITSIKGIEQNRTNLQNVGAELMHTIAPSQFVKEVFAYGIGNAIISNSTLLVEGVRHLSILNEIKKISHNCFVIYIDLKDEELITNAIKRDEIEVIDAKRFFCHEVESGIDSLKEYADYVLTTVPLNDDLTEICKRIENSLYPQDKV